MNTGPSKPLGSGTLIVPSVPKMVMGFLPVEGAEARGEAGGDHAGAAVLELHGADDVVGRFDLDLLAVLGLAGDGALGDGDGGHAGGALDRARGC